MNPGHDLCRVQPDVGMRLHGMPIDWISTLPLPPPQRPRLNTLLEALPGEESDRLLPRLEGMALTQGQVLHESGREIRYVYFPTTAIVSRLCVMENGDATEITMVGNEGMVGVAIFMGGEAPATRIVVQNSGHAYRLPAQLLREEFAGSAFLQSLLLRYTQAVLTHMAQTSVCIRHHTLDRQFCRWLLLNLDRAPSNHIALTQEMIAGLLGVRRESITEACGRLRRSGLIASHRGYLTVLDRAGLERRTCECYGVIKDAFERLLPRPASLQLPRPVAARRPADHPSSGFCAAFQA